MKLKHFRVTNFRNFVDSGTIFVDSKITALVGKNESGKTAALQCLDRLNSSQSNKFGIQEHYPRSKLSKDRKRENLEEVVPIRATLS